MEESRISYPPLGDSGPGTMCPRHNLRRGPKGECVICKREREQREAERKKRGRVLIPTISIVGLLGAAADIAFNVVSMEKPASAITQSGSDEALERESARPANAAFQDEPQRRVRPTEVNADDREGTEEAEPEARGEKADQANEGGGGVGEATGEHHHVLHGPVPCLPQGHLIHVGGGDLVHGARRR